MDTSIRDQLATLATHLENGTMSHHTVAATLRNYAARNLVTLPVIHPERDDLGHWQELSDQRLRCEVAADSWNLAAGVFEHRKRVAAREQWLAEQIAQFSGVPDDTR